ncbi:hypothetical protein CBL_02951 [Carabus blaptoides fortunei]
MAKQDFKDIQKAADAFINTSKLQITKLTCTKVTKHNPTKLKVKKSFNEFEEWEEMQVLKKGKNKNEQAAVMLNVMDTINRITKEKYGRYDSLFASRTSGLLQGPHKETFLDI